MGKTTRAGFLGVQTEILSERRAALEEVLLGYGSVAVALSGGTDSTLLARIAHDVLGDRMMAMTLAGVAAPAEDVRRAAAWAADEGMAHMAIPFDELSIPEFVANGPERCYHCKRALFGELARVASEHGMAVVADGSNVDDEGDYRPGLRALRELGIKSPLREAGLTKADVRALSHELGLPTWNLPSAACLASRFAYGERITAEKLARVDAAEQWLHGLGISQLRVRVHGADGELARVEVAPSDIGALAAPAARERIVRHLRAIGFTYVTLDLLGFRSGAMNEVLTDHQHA